MKFTIGGSAQQHKLRVVEFDGHVWTLAFREPDDPGPSLTRAPDWSDRRGEGFARCATAFADGHAHAHTLSFERKASLFLERERWKRPHTPWETQSSDAAACSGGHQRRRNRGFQLSLSCSSSSSSSARHSVVIAQEDIDPLRADRGALDRVSLASRAELGGTGIPCSRSGLKVCPSGSVTRCSVRT